MSTGSRPAPVSLRGLCWDHPRCTEPMAAAAAAWRRLHPHVAVEWEARPLAAFNDQPITEAVRGYDLVFVDHPAIAEAVPSGCLRALDELLPATTLAALAEDSVAGSHGTYRYAGHQWALAVDAACQVAVADEERLRTYAERPPSTWREVIRLSRRAPGAVAIPLYPSDAIISLISITVGLGRARGVPAPAALIDPAPAALIDPEAVELLCELVAHVDRRSFDLNPPGLLALMAVGPDAPSYAPLLFGYTNFQRPDRPGRRLRFLDAPTAGGTPGGTVLGGAGLAVPSGSGSPGDAAAFAAWIAGARAQRDIVCPYGGQPASRRVWDDPSADALLGGFLSGTRATMLGAFVRPAAAWWPRFQEAAGERLVALLSGGASANRIFRELTAIAEAARPTPAAPPAPHPEESAR
jgi:multiple sugar transport system substrate-binding protein